LAGYLAALLGWIDAEPNVTMPELAAKLKAEKDVTALSQRSSVDADLIRLTNHV